MNEFPPVFHWSPVERRGQILRYGLRPGMRPTVTTPGWRAPYVCFAETPSWAWALSGGQGAEPGTEWDLWQCQINGLEVEEKPTYDEHRWHELRVYERVFKRRIWHVATRTVR